MSTIPASDPKSVLGCGGTKVTASGATLTDEAVWNSNGGGTGGGVSALFTRPAVPAGAGAAQAQRAQGRARRPRRGGERGPGQRLSHRARRQGRTLIGGTSAVAPLWAAIAALLNAGRVKPLGQPHPALYAASGDFHDVTQGDNKAGNIGYSAGPGWDPCTGLGSPDGAALRAGLVDRSTADPPAPS